MNTDRRQQKGAIKTPKGAGYTTRVDGKKKLTTSLLEQQLDQAQAKLRELQQQNMLLRTRETMYSENLEGAEMAVYYMGSLAQAAAGPQQTMQCLLPAVLLDMQALKLKQALQPSPQHSQDSPATGLPTANPQDAHSILARAFATVQAARAARSAGGAVSSSSSGSGSSGASEKMEWAGAPVGPSGRRMQRLMASITIEEVQEARTLSLQGAAERLRDSIAGVRKARQEADADASGAASADGVSAAIDKYIRTQMISVLSDEPRHCHLIGMNLETLQQEVPPDRVWLDAVRAAKLLPQQLQHIAMALQTSTQQQAQLLQKQQAIMQQLQALLGAAAAVGPQDTTAAAADAAAAADDDGQTSPPSSPAPFSLAASPASTTTGAGADGDDDGGGPATQAVAAAAADADAVPASAAAAAALPAEALAASTADTTIAGRTRAGVRKANAAAAAAVGGCSSGKHRQQASSEPANAADNSKLQGCEAMAGSLSPSGAAASKDSTATRVGSPADSQASLPLGVAAAGGAAAAGAAAASAASSSSGSMPGGVLAVEDAEQAEVLLQEWQRVCWAMKRQGRLLASMLMNMLSSEQLADATIAGYPYIVPAPKFCACAVQKMSQQ